MENKLELKIGTPVIIRSINRCQYDDYYYLGNGVVGTMNLPYKTNDIFFIPAFNVFEESWIEYVIPCSEIERFNYFSMDYYHKSNIIDLDDLDNCLYTKEGFEWWNDKQKEEIKTFYIS